MSLTSHDVHQLLRLLDAVPADELELETEGFRVVLRRADDGEWVRETDVTAIPDVVASEAAPGHPAGEAADARSGSEPPPAAKAERRAQPPPAAEVEREGLVDVVAPLLGTFYRAPKPGAPAFVELGTPVEEDSAVGLVETMKLFNSVAAGVRGTVAEICVDDAQFVEQGAVLLRIDPER